jgi:hypothetical protein
VIAPALVPSTVTQVPCQRFARTTLHATSRRLTSRSSAASFTWAVLWLREVLHGVVNHRRIDGKDAVAGSRAAGLLGSCYRFQHAQEIIFGD